MNTAPCTVVDPELFFPPAYGASHGEAVRVAKAVCAGCRLRRECLQQALSTAEEFGIWGGTTPLERQRLTAMRSRSRPVSYA